MHSDLPLKFRRPIERPLGSPDTSAEFRSRTRYAFCVSFRAEPPVDAVRSASSAGSRAYLRLGELGETLVSVWARLHVLEILPRGLTRSPMFSYAG